MGARVTVLRCGSLVATDEVQDVNKGLIIRWMGERYLTNTYLPRTVTQEENVLQVRY